MKDPIAIVGMGCLFPEGGSLDAFWETLRAGRDGIGPVPLSHWRPEDYFDADPKAPDRTYARRGGFLAPYAFDPLAYGIAPNAIEATDTSQLLAMVAAHAALEDAGYGPKATFDRERASVVMGVTGALELVIPLGARLGHPLWRRALAEAGVDAETARDVMERVSDGYVGWQEASFPGLLGNVVAGRIASRFDFGGTNCVVDAACASSLAAVNLAVQELTSGRSDLVVTGGVDTFNDIFMYMCFSKTPALSPTGDARPFSEAADGTILGEGVAALVLKRLSDARRDGDRVYAIIKAVGSSSDGRGQAIYAPSANGQAKALRRAYAEAGISPRDVGLVEAHGTGTKVGDAVELEALATVYGEQGGGAPWCALGSVKSQIGHAKAAAGAAGLIKAAMALHHRVLPPTIKVERPSAALAGTPFRVSIRARPWVQDKRPRYAAVSAFGFGGSNYHCVLEEADAASARLTFGGEAQIVAFGAETPGALVQALRGAVASHDWEAVRLWADRTRRAFDPRSSCRLVLVVTRDSDLQARLSSLALRLERAAGEAVWSEVDAWLGRGEPAGGVAFLFPGQGSQYPGMAQDVAVRAAVAREALGCSRVLADLMHPTTAFSADERGAQERALRATEVAQPALGAASLAWLAVLGELGVRCDVAMGHSFGELVALHAAGVFDAETLRGLAAVRGEAMAAAAAVAGDTGMTAVLAPRADVEALLLSVRHGGLVLANDNAPGQVVVAGAKAALDAFESDCRARGMKSKRLAVAAAFHSPAVAAATEPFAAAVRRSPWQAPKVPVIANATAEGYALSEKEGKELLGKQLASPVRFREGVLAAYAAGARTFVEVGPKAVLTGLAQEVLHGRVGVRCIAVDASSGRANGEDDLARAIAAIAAAGHGVRLDAWDPRPEAAVQAGFTVTLTGANHRNPVAARPPRLKTPKGGKDDDMGMQDDVIKQGLAALLESQRATQQAMLKMMEEGATALAVSDPPNAFAAAPNAAVPRVDPGRAPVVAPVVPPTVPPAVPPVTKSSGSPSAATLLLDVVAAKTGYPVAMLDLTMQLEADLGIDSIKRVEIVAAFQERHPEARTLPQESLMEVRTLQDIVDALGKSLAPAQAQAPARISAPRPSARREAVILRELPELPEFSGRAPRNVLILDEGTTLGVAVVAQLASLGSSVSVQSWSRPTAPDALLDAVLMIAPPRSREPRRYLEDAFTHLRSLRPHIADGAPLAIVTQGGGSFGIADAPKTTDDALLLALAGLAKTAALEWPTLCVRALDVAPEAALARALVTEVLACGAPVEVGINARGRHTPALVARTVAPAPRVPLGAGDLVVVTGGARGVTSAAVRALAGATRAPFLLLGRTSLVDEPAAARGITEPAILKAALAQHLGSQATPRSLQALYDSVLHGREIRATISDLRAVGSFADYRAVDVRDAGAVRAHVADAIAEHGPVRAVVHGAGVLADRWLEDLTPEQVAAVLETKLGGLAAVMSAIDPTALKALALFSSSTARFGRKGQGAYAVANEALNKLAQHYQAALPAARVVALDWGPWDGGMVGPSVREQFLREGIGIIPLAAGADAFLDELVAQDRIAEVVVLAPGEPLATFTIDARRDPVLADHRLGGRAVVPAALSAEWLAAAAVQAEPGLPLTAIEHFRVLKGLTLAPSESTQLRIERRGMQREGAEIALDLALIREQTLLATATVRLGSAPNDGGAHLDVVAPHVDLGGAALYERILFHGPRLHCIDTVSRSGPAGIVASVSGYAAPQQWMADPWRSDFVTAPLLVDACFQLLIVWSEGERGAPCLPTGYQRYVQLAPVVEGPYEAIVVVTASSAHGVMADARLVDAAGRTVALMIGAEAAISPRLRAAFDASSEVAATP